MYAASAGPIAQLATQPYDTIPPELAKTYRARNVFNAVHLILPLDDGAVRWREWRDGGVLVQAPEPGLWAYEQRFPVPETGERLVRRGFVALGEVTGYGAGVYRHERTLDAPVAERLRLLQSTGAQLESLFLLYEDAEAEVEALLGEPGAAAVRFTDDDATEHLLWRVPDAEAVQRAMGERRWLIADGHHRYEAALRHGQRRAMMTFVRMESAGLRSLAAHRLIDGVAVDRARLLDGAERVGSVAEVWRETPRSRVQFGIAVDGELWRVELQRPQDALNLTVLHERVLQERMDISPRDIAGGRYVRYCRGAQRAIAAGAQVALLVEPLQISEVARMAFTGESLPQKSTDFYPKLASGLLFHELEP